VYTVVGTNAITGCTASASQLVVANESPMVFATASKPVICAGESTNLVAIASGANNTYAWSGSSVSGAMISVSPSSNTSYTVIATNNFACTGSAVVNVSVNPAPPVAITSNDTDALVCEEDVTTLTGAGALSYQWNSPISVLMGAQVQVSPQTTVTYTLVGTDANGCKGTATYELNVTECVGLKDVSATASGIKLYPNPTSGEFIVDTKFKTEWTLEVTDLTGRLLLTQTSNIGKVNVNLNTFANGVYYVKVVSDQQTEVIKIVKH